MSAHDLAEVIMEHGEERTYLRGKGGAGLDSELGLGWLHATTPSAGHVRSDQERESGPRQAESTWHRIMWPLHCQEASRIWHAFTFREKSALYFSCGCMARTCLGTAISETEQRAYGAPQPSVTRQRKGLLLKLRFKAHSLRASSSKPREQCASLTQCV